MFYKTLYITILSHNIGLLVLPGASENRLIKVRPQQNVALKNGLPEEKALGEGVLKETPSKNTPPGECFDGIQYIVTLRKLCLNGTFMATKRFSDAPISMGRRHFLCQPGSLGLKPGINKCGPDFLKNRTNHISKLQLAFTWPTHLGGFDFVTGAAGPTSKVWKNFTLLAIQTWVHLAPPLLQHYGSWKTDGKMK